jgi:hypothetical protein
VSKDKSALTLIILFFIAELFVSTVSANPYSQALYKGTINASSNPAIHISAQYNNSKYNKNSLSIPFNVSIQKTSNLDYHVYISKVYFTADWMSGDVILYRYYNQDPSRIEQPVLEGSYTINLTNIPEGKHNLNIHAIEGGDYYPSYFEYFMLSSNSTISLAFTIDTIRPNVGILLENHEYNEPSFPLNFSVNEPIQRTSYSLDDQTNVTVKSNTTLTGLGNGPHNVTVYAWDLAGNVGASETTFFTIEAPEPNTPPASPALLSVMFAALASSVSIGVFAVVGLVLYNKKHKR